MTYNFHVQLPGLPCTTLFNLWLNISRVCGTKLVRPPTLSGFPVTYIITLVTRPSSRAQTTPSHEEKGQVINYQVLYDLFHSKPRVLTRHDQESAQ